LESIYNIQSGKSSDHLGKATKCDHKYRKPGGGAGLALFLGDMK